MCGKCKKLLFGTHTSNLLSLPRWLSLKTSRTLRNRSEKHLRQHWRFLFLTSEKQSQSSKQSYPMIRSKRLQNLPLVHVFVAKLDKTFRHCQVKWRLTERVLRCRVFVRGFTNKMPTLSDERRIPIRCFRAHKTSNQDMCFLGYRPCIVI